MPQQVRKAVIPAAGLGTRFLPATKAQPKEMLPLVDKPAIQYVVEEAVSVGITDILVITGRGKRSLEDHFDRSFELEYYLEQGGKTSEVEEMRRIAEMAEIHYVRQGEPKGLGHAVLVAAEHVGDSPFAVLLGDDIMHPSAGVLPGMLETFEHYGHSVIALKEVPKADISSYGCADVKPLEGNVVKVEDLVEKPSPEEAPSNLAVMGRYVFGPAIFEVLARTQPGRGGEIQLTDAIKTLAESEPVYGWTFRNGRFDVGNKVDYLIATVELALERDDVGPPLRRFLTERLARDDA
ncbi:MAG TPA: UTP--glucose-1-phosphate uridylyltransferase GalU [Acidimicrobiales bacterium]|nr:UTP--glucose-1-phosphate uridylyltransferase GalU [Acidimicrobiales bacterium]